MGVSFLNVGDSASLTIGSAAYDTKDAGSGKTVTASGISLTSNPNNYLLGSTTASAAAGRINAEPITITAVTNTKTYDGSTTAAAIPILTSGMLYGSDGFSVLSESYTSKKRWDWSCPDPCRVNLRWERRRELCGDLGFGLHRRDQSGADHDHSGRQHQDLRRHDLSLDHPDRDLRVDLGNGQPRRIF